MELAYAPRLRAIKPNGRSRAAIISHLHERGFLMNNSIDLLFRWKISLGMYLTFLRRKSEPAQCYRSRETAISPLSTTSFRGTIRSLMFCNGHFYNNTARCRECVRALLHTVDRIGRGVLSQARFHCNRNSVTICKREYK